MYQLRYFVYLSLSILGGWFLTKMVPNSEILSNATWIMASNVLFELLDWKYGGQKTDETI